MFPDYNTIETFQDLKEYLIAVRPEALGRPVLKYDIKFVSGEGIVRQKHLMLDGSTKWMFYGYLVDVLHNIKLGLLEPKEIKP